MAERRPDLDSLCARRRPKSRSGRKKACGAVEQKKAPKQERKRRRVERALTMPTTRSGGRRPKSAKARNRGGWGTRRCRGRYGDLGGWCVPVRFDGSGPGEGFRSNNVCGFDFERTTYALREQIWGGATGRSGATMQAGALPAESEPEGVGAVADRW